MGGRWLVSSLGSDLIARFQGWEWLLAPIGLAKLIAALAPIALARKGWPARRLARSACSLGALALAGVVRPQSGYDHAGMIGHAYLWDPLFLAWGVGLAMGLLASRSRHPLSM